MRQGIVDLLMQALREMRRNPGAREAPSAAKVKHLEFIQAAIARMSSTSSLFKGWSITLATALAGFAAVQSRTALLVIAIVSTMLFWAMDGYYLWLERGFVQLYNKVAASSDSSIDFAMAIDKSRGFRRWLRTCIRWHLVLFYGAILIVDAIGIVLIKGGK